MDKILFSLKTGFESDDFNSEDDAFLKKNLQKTQVFLWIFR